MIRQDDDNPAVLAAEGLMTLLYGDAHPFGWRPRGTVESLARLGRHDLQAFHAARLRPGCLSVAVVGDVSPDRAVSAVESVLGGQMFPLDLLPPWAYSAAHYLPFYYQMYFPAAIFTGRISDPNQIAQGFVIQLAWVAILLAVNQGLWVRGLRRHTAVGG